MKKRIYKNTTPVSYIYWLGSIGSGMCFISIPPGFRVGLLGILKAIIWPVFLIFKAFSFIYKYPGNHE